MYIHICVCVCVLTRKDELAAVTVPCGLIKAGFSLAICSMEDGRMPLSLETISRPGKDKNISCIFYCDTTNQLQHTTQKKK